MKLYDSVARLLRETRRAAPLHTSLFALSLAVTSVTVGRFKLQTYTKVTKDKARRAMLPRTHDGTSR